MGLINEIPTGAFIILSALIAGFFAVFVPRYNRASDASNSFRGNVIDLFKDVYPTPEKLPDNLKEIVKIKYPSLNSEIHKFRPFIPWYKRKKFNQDWNNFRGFDKDDCFSRNTDFFKYAEYSIDGVQNKGSEQFKSNLTILLSYAKKI
ncbi:MAG: hypothetical protein ACJAUT_000460 [Cellvibrionaceae bacterium]|jgi:hypothetical protein